MSKVLSSIACNLDLHLLAAALPLFEAEKVQAMEWSFDVLYHQPERPDWFEALVAAFSSERRLIGHGVFFSLFKAKWSTEQTQWLRDLQIISRTTPFDHLTEHFGFFTGRDFHTGAPLSVPFTPQTLAIGRDRLQRIQAACVCPVGLENLAFAYSLDEVRRHGDFLAQLLEPVNGFIILDLHNLFCQLHNFQLAFETLLALYPLEKVREIHISGGSWDVHLHDASQKIRRDTHDDNVPDAVFELLEKALPICPNLKYVVLEQMGTALQTEAERAAYRQDFERMDKIVARFNLNNQLRTIAPFLPRLDSTLAEQPLENTTLFEQQRQLSDILETSAHYQQAQERLRHSTLHQSAWQVEQWDEAMLHTALQIAQKWKGE